MPDASGDRERLDQYLVRTGFAASRRAAQELIAERRVSVNGRTPRKSDVVRTSDRVEVQSLPSVRALVPDPEVAIDPLYIDEALIVVNKPGLMPCHPLKPGERGTLMNGVVARFPETASAGSSEREGGLVHRLDNGTSGAVMIARTQVAHTRLRRDLRAGKIIRTYQALVMGTLSQALDLDEPIGHRRSSARKMGTLSSGARLRGHPRAAATHVQPLRQVGHFTLVSVTPHSGSRHQIRVHLVAAGYPIVNDTLYEAPPIVGLPEGRFWLHLGRLELESPSARPIVVDAPLAADLAAFLERANHP